MFYMIFIWSVRGDCTKCRFNMGLIVPPFAKSPNAPKSRNQMSANGGGLLYIYF